MATTSELLERARSLVERGKLPNGDVPVVLATADAAGNPDARYVLLKEIDAEGFVFYTNARSVKGAQLKARPRAALVFYWPALASQLRVQGAVEEVGEKIADAYWKTRARDSRLASMASEQSAPLASRKALLAKLEALTKEYQGTQDIPRPKHWTGYRVVPDRIEFWTGREHRLHDRELFEKKGKQWHASLLNP